MIRQFHEFFESSIWWVFDNWPKLDAPEGELPKLDIWARLAAQDKLAESVLCPPKLGSAEQVRLRSKWIRKQGAALSSQDGQTVHFMNHNFV